VVPSPRQPLAATDLYQVFDTSDVPAASSTSSQETATNWRRRWPSMTMWRRCGISARGRLSDGRGRECGKPQAHMGFERQARDWLSREQGQGAEYLRRAVQVKNIWMPYGE
jgi:aldehyde dehydrogenase (NAD+)